MAKLKLKAKLTDRVRQADKGELCYLCLNPFEEGGKWPVGRAQTYYLCTDCMIGFERPLIKITTKAQYVPTLR